ncbi:MAG: hypothetical protein NT154_37555 [Verrucomicrobia bacterium]|nr:hypothetical protein [Verrucomicrobiota bacterium]
MDASKLVRQPTPAAWRKEFKESEVSVLPLVKDVSRKYQSGWISYRAGLLDSPEVEIISGGLSERGSDGAALWRQGHLLHFAFDIAPADMNENGKALLLNSIAYIARFTEDRPIARTPSAWAEKADAPKSKRWIEGLFASRIPPETDLDYYLSPDAKAIVKTMDRQSYPKWYKENSPFLTCGKDGRLMVDANAKKFGIAFDQPDFFPKAIARLGDTAGATKARELLKRYAPDGPATGSAEEWAKWWETNRPYLFYSEGGGYRWYLDPLAKRRGVPSDKLQGPARATGG